MRNEEADVVLLPTSLFTSLPHDIDNEVDDMTTSSVRSSSLLSNIGLMHTLTALQ